MTGVLLNAGAQLLLKAGTNVLGVHHAHARRLGRHADADGDAGLLRAGRRAATSLSLFVWILGLSRVPVSIAYPLLSVGYVVNAIAAHYLFGEAVTADALARHRLHRRRRLARRAKLTARDASP